VVIGQEQVGMVAGLAQVHGRVLQAARRAMVQGHTSLPWPT
jgi:hypothetical protein